MFEDTFLRPVLTFILKLFFRIEVRGVEHYAQAGEKVVIISNHQSFLDPLLLAVFIPKKPAFVMNIYQARKWYFRWVPKIVTLYRIDPAQPMSMKRLIQDLRRDAKAVIFPEGRITTSGGLMKMYEGTGMVVEKSGATILPIRIDGAEYSKLSMLSKKVRQRWFPKITITFLPPVRFEPGQKVTGRMLYDVMASSAFAASDSRRPLLDAIISGSKLHGAGKKVATDISRDVLNYRQLFTRSFILSDKLRPSLSSEQKYVAVLLPNMLGTVVTFTALQMMGKTACMLNFSSGAANILHACRIANVKTVLTSRVFIERGKLEALVEALGKEYTLIYLEDIRSQVTLNDKLNGLWKGFFARSVLAESLARVHPDDPAVVLYTSGSEGTPKGAALSHANILANINQIRARLDLTPADIVFNALPVFHSFGLSVGMLMPLVCGLKTFLYPSPVHYRVIPELIYDSDATIMLGTDTFFNGYARYAHSYDFWNIRLAVAGAEKLKESTRRLYADQFGVMIMQGYGVTETSPVISFNTRIEHKAGTVGRLFPGMEYKLEKVEGLEHGSRLLIKGPNVMLGYLKGDKPGVIQPQGDWYDTGDIVELDERGFITIMGRAKRFAKIAGEMVSLPAVEDLAADAMPNSAHAAIAVADERKGEQIILFSESSDLKREQLITLAKENGVPAIYLPQQVKYMEKLPRLGTGKIDYPALAKLAAEPTNA